MDRPYGWTGYRAPFTPPTVPSSPPAEEKSQRPLTPLEEHSVKTPVNVPAAAEVFVDREAKLLNQPQITIPFDVELARALIVSNLEYSETKVKEEAASFFKGAGIEEETKRLEADTPNRTFLKRKLETDKACDLDTPRNAFELQIANIFKSSIHAVLDQNVAIVTRDLPFYSLSYQDRAVVKEIVYEVLKENFQRIYRLCVCSTYAISMLEDPKKFDGLKAEILSVLTRYDELLSKSTQMERIFEMYLLVLTLVGNKDNEIQTTLEIREFLRSCEAELDEFYGLYKLANDTIRKQIPTQLQQLFIQAQQDLQEHVFTEVGLDYITDNLNQIINECVRKEIKECNEAYLSIFLKVNEYALRPTCKKYLITVHQANPGVRCQLVLTPTETTFNSCFDGTMFSSLIYIFLGKFEKMNKGEAEKLFLEQCDVRYAQMMSMLKKALP